MSPDQRPDPLRSSPGEASTESECGMSRARRSLPPGGRQLALRVAAGPGPMGPDPRGGEAVAMPAVARTLEEARPIERRDADTKSNMTRCSRGGLTPPDPTPPRSHRVRGPRQGAPPDFRSRTPGGPAPASTRRSKSTHRAESARRTGSSLRAGIARLFAEKETSTEGSDLVYGYGYPARQPKARSGGPLRSGGRVVGIRQVGPDPTRGASRQRRRLLDGRGSPWYMRALPSPANSLELPHFRTRRLNGPAQSPPSSKAFGGR